MTLPPLVERLWHELESVRAEVLREVELLTQRQGDWKPSDHDWSIGEIVDHLTIAENATGKLTTKLVREAEAAGKLAPFPSDLAAFAPLPSWPPGPAEAPPVVQPQHGKSFSDLVGAMKATRGRSRSSIERLGSVDPRSLTFKHFRLGELDLAQWWTLQAHHDGAHLAQIREVKATPGFPRT
jgi:DinB family protein